MRILHLVSYSIYSGPMPGVLGLIEAQLSAGYDVALAYDHLRGELGGYEESLSPRHFPTGLQILSDLKMSPKASVLEQLRDRKRLRHFVLTSKIDIVHCHLSHDHAIASLSLKNFVPIVRTVHAARAFMRRFCWPLFDATVLIARSHNHQALLRQRCKTYEMPVFAVPGGVTLHSERKHPSREDITSFRFAKGIPADATLILNCAHISDRGQKELISAMVGLERVYLVLAGDGPDISLLRQHASEVKLADRVLFTGYLPFPDLSQVYRSADLAVVAQVGNDGSARAALEAIDFALPLLVVADGGSLDALASSLRTSITVSPSKQPEDLFSALSTMLERLPSLKEAARTNRESYLSSLDFRQEFEATHQAYRAAQASYGGTL